MYLNFKTIINHFVWKTSISGARFSQKWLRFKNDCRSWNRTHCFTDYILSFRQQTHFQKYFVPSIVGHFASAYNTSSSWRHRAYRRFYAQKNSAKLTRCARIWWFLLSRKPGWISYHINIYGVILRGCVGSGSNDYVNSVIYCHGWVNSTHADNFLENCV